MLSSIIRILIATSLVWLGGCAGPLTTARTGVSQCHQFLIEADGGAANPLDLPAERTVNMLILSGGGAFGAYGAGVLSGWSAAERDGAAGMKRSSITVVTGISTGALQATAATIGNAEPDPVKRIIGPDADLIRDYEVTDKDIGRTRSPLLSLRSNGLVDIRGGLDVRVRTVVDRYWDRLRNLPPNWRTYVGLVNLDNGRFYIADLLAVARSSHAKAKDCYVEFILASAAVPVQFPPRYIDGSPYVDGGVRFGVFLGERLAQSAAIRSAEGDKLTVNFRTIINGTLSANNARDDALGALRCDNSRLPVTSADCPAAGNSLLGIAQRAAGDILVDQIYRDSARRLELELQRAGALGSAEYVYVPNARLAEGGCRRGSKQAFDPQFMRCLTKLGEADGRKQAWLSSDVLPQATGPGR